MERVFARGAEAVLRKGEWHGRAAVLKERVVKGYRDPALDERLRTHRLRVEARLISTARSMGVLVPLIYDVDAERNMLV
ncbi:MAG: serine/threonine protein kinase, partial [Candidatus Thermoplasmatota archaeon]